jgi:hypothetical protein
VLQWVNDWFSFEAVADYEGQVELVTDNSTRTAIGMETHIELIAEFEEIGATGRRDTLESAGDIRAHPSDHLSVRLVYLHRGYLVLHVGDYLTEEDGERRLPTSLASSSWPIEKGPTIRSALPALHIASHRRSASSYSD